jgi:hypothetical protein
MAFGWGGFASGLQAGSQAMQRAQQAQIDRENQEYLQAEREQQRMARSEYAQATAPAQTTTHEGGLMVQGPDGKTFRLSQEAVDAGAYNAYDKQVDAEGNKIYSVAGSSNPYQEVTAGGRTIGQREITPELAELGYEPARGLQEQYNAGRNQRLMDVATKYGRWSDAASISGLTTNELNQKKLTLDIEDRPQERRARDVTIRTGEAALTKAERENERNRIEDAAFAASRSPETALKFFNDADPDDGPVELVPTKDGKQQFVQTSKDGKTKTVIGKPFSNWDEGREQVLSGLPRFAETQFTKGLEHRNKLAEIEAQTRGRLKEVAAMKADKKINWEPGQREEYSKIEAQIADAVEKGDYNKIGQLNARLQVLTNKVLMANNRPPQTISTPQRNDQQYTNTKTWQESATKLQERLQASGQWPRAPEDQEEVLIRELGPRPSERGGGSFQGGGGRSGVVSGPNAASNRDSGPARGTRGSTPPPARDRPQTTDTVSTYGMLTPETVLLRDVQRGVPAAIAYYEKRERDKAEARGLMEQNRGSMY